MNENETQENKSQERTETKDKEIQKDNDPDNKPTNVTANLLFRRNPERTRRCPARLTGNEFEVKAITIENKDLIKTLNRKTRGIGLTSWKLFLGMMWLLILGICKAKTITNSSESFIKLHIFNSSENVASYFGRAHICGVKESIQHTYLCHKYLIVETGKIGWKYKQTNSLCHLFFKRTFSGPIVSYACEIEVSSVTTYMGFFGTKAVLDKTLYYRAADLNNAEEKRNS